MMTLNPSVSVITPFLNSERFIAEAIESVIVQTYQDWELFLIDDGSTDGGAPIAQHYASLHPGRIHYLQHRAGVHHGASATRNLGIRHALGRYIAFLDADDVWLPQKLERQVALLEARPDVGMLCGASRYWWTWAGSEARPGRDVVAQVGAALDAVSHPPTLLLGLYPLGMGSAPCPSSIIVRDAAIDRVGGWEDAFTVLYTDQAFLSKIYLSVPIYISSECYTMYRQHDKSSVELISERGSYHTIRHEFLSWLESYLVTKGYDDPKIWEALQVALWPYRQPLVSWVLRGRFLRYRHHHLARLARLSRAVRRRLPAAFDKPELETPSRTPSRPADAPAEGPET